MNSNALPKIITATASGLVANADRLGLTWQLYLATVAYVSEGIISVTVDGDATAVPATSMIGVVRPGQRVYVIAIPPGGLFVVGYAETRPIGCSLQRVNQSIPDGGPAATVISWDTILRDTDNVWKRATPTLIRVPVIGLWSMTLIVNIVGGGGLAAGGRGFISILVDGLPYRQSMAGSGESFAGQTIIVPVTPSQTLTFDAYCDTAAGATTFNAILHCYRVGDY